MDIIKEKTSVNIFLFFLLLFIMLIILCPQQAHGSIVEALKEAPMIEDNTLSIAFATIQESTDEEIQEITNLQIKISSLYEAYAAIGNEQGVSYLANKVNSISTEWDKHILECLYNEVNEYLTQAQERIAKEQAAILRAQQEEKGQQIVSASYSVSSPGYGLCAAWVTDVYQAAGYNTNSGNANDLYYAYCNSSNKEDIIAGMIIAVPSHTNTSAGRIYGHCGILVWYENGWYVRENVGYINEQPLDDWIAYYGTTYTPQWGFAET